MRASGTLSGGTWGWATNRTPESSWNAAGAGAVLGPCAFFRRGEDAGTGSTACGVLPLGTAGIDMKGVVCPIAAVCRDDCVALG